MRAATVVVLLALARCAAAQAASSDNIMSRLRQHQQSWQPTAAPEQQQQASSSQLDMQELAALATLRDALSRPTELLEHTDFRETWWGNATDDPCKTWAGVICENGHVESIVLQKMRLHGTIPQFVEGDFPSLRVFSVSNNALHGTIPSSVGFLTALSQLHINLNILTGTLPSELGRLTQLELLEVDGGFTSFQRVRSTTAANYYGAEGTHYGNQLVGSIPSTLGNLGRLSLLNMHRNMLTGTLPWELGRLSALSYVDLSGNYLSGTIPEVLLTLPHLRVVQLDDLRLVGTVPSSIADAPSLEVFVVEGNMMEGQLPKHLPPRLTEIDLHENRFTGTLPEAWATDAPLLNIMLLHINQLGGTIPAAYARMPRMHSFSFAHNWQLCGDAPALPMPHPEFLERECDKPGEECSLWPETNGSRINLPCERGNAGPTVSSPPCGDVGAQCSGIDETTGRVWTGSACCVEGTRCVQVGPRRSECAMQAPDSRPVYQEEAVCAARWDQCGGAGWKGLTCCEDSSDCDAIGPYYAHCVPRS